MYLVYWAWILTKVRYAIFPFALLSVLIAARLRTFYDAQRGGAGWWVGISLLGVQTYCLLIAMMGLMIVGINGPQFAYFAGRLDKPGYLRAAMQAYGAVEFLDRTDRTHARVLGVENEARAYAPDPSNFDAMWCPEPGTMQRRKNYHQSRRGQGGVSDPAGAQSSSGSAGTARVAGKNVSRRLFQRVSSELSAGELAAPLSVVKTPNSGLGRPPKRAYRR